MPKEMSKRICVVPRVQGVGGMVSFKNKLVGGLQRRGIETCDDLADQPYEAVLVIGGARQLGGLWRARRNGVRVVQRLDGMNWLHRLGGIEGGRRQVARHYLKAEYGNALLALVRRRLASVVVYQSEFVRGWWDRVYRPVTVPSRVIYNGVDLQLYSPQGSEARQDSHYRLLMVEGSLAGGYERGLESAIELAVRLGERMDTAHSHTLEVMPIELQVAGQVSADLQTHWTKALQEMRPDGQVRLAFTGMIPAEHIPALDRSAHCLYSADLNAACPNAAIEALACGLPVLAYDTGALRELVTPEAGRVTPYGGNPWKIEKPDVSALAEAGLEIFCEQERFRHGARQRAEQAFDLESMVEAYLDVLLS